MNNKTLRQHAEKELSLIDMEKNYPDAYNTLKVIVDTLEDFREKCGEREAAYIMDLFEMIIRGDNLAPITDDPDEWEYKKDATQTGNDLWQNNRNSNIYSSDGGRTWFDLSDPHSQTVLSTISGKRNKNIDKDKGKTSGSEAKQSKAKQSDNQGQSTKKS